MSSSGNMVLCPFWKESRFKFAVQICDNLVEGVPSCVLEGFYPDEEDSFDVPLVCAHFVFTDVYTPKSKNGCYFGGAKCINSNVKGFGACGACVRWLKK